MADITTGAGTTIGLSASAPGAYTSGGYGALSFTTIGKIINLGNLPSRVYEIITQQTVSGRGTYKAKGGYDLGSQEITFAVDDSDTGQILLATANSSDTVYSVAIVHPTLGTIYARALVQLGAKVLGDNNTAVTQTCTLHYTVPNDSTDGVVVV